MRRKTGPRPRRFGREAPWKRLRAYTRWDVMTAFRTAVLTFALAAATAAPAAAQPQAIAPGYWETTNQVLSPLRSTKTERRCIRPADVAKFMEGPGNHIYHCTYPTRVFRDGQIELKGSCKSRDGAPFPIAGSGTFTRESFHLDARASAPLGPVKIPVHAVTDARRLGAECPAEPEPAQSAPAQSAPSDAAGDASPSGNGEAH